MERYKIIVLLVISLIFVNKVNANTESHDVIISGVDTPGKYDIDIKWDSMQFKYIEEEKYLYDNNKHVFNRNINKYWSSNSNNINIKNKSLRKIDINLKYKKIESNVAVKFSKNNFSINSLEEQNIKINLTGSIDNTYNEFRNIGEISIVVS